MEKNEYKNICDFANSNNINLSGVKKFKGSPEVIHEVVSSLANSMSNFQNVFDSYKLNLNIEPMSKKDFAATRGRIITLNKDYYHNIDILKAEYKNCMDKGWFVKGTDYRAIIHHEFGHVVSEIYKVDSIKVACEITNLNENEIFQFIKKNLSEYAFSNTDGSEIIAEVFADIFNGNASGFSQKFYSKILTLSNKAINLKKK